MMVKLKKTISIALCNDVLLDGLGLQSAEKFLRFLFKVNIVPLLVQKRPEKNTSLTYAFG